MNKYDFGYSMEDGTTNSWAFEMIKEGSIVLELGPAVGNLTRHLRDEKKCTIDVVEIDKEAGIKAKEFAREALLGEDYGNLNNYLWYEALKNKRYDYIVVLDVLEHLENPGEVLKLLKELLNDNGKVILSIPNIAHNSIILELFVNNFPYSDLGLLDRTHIHFFTYYTILQMIKESELHISLIDSIQKVVSDTEFNCDYGKLPIEVEHYLKTRKFGDVYQFLLILEKEQEEIIDYLEEGILDASLYESKVLVNGLLQNLVSVKGKFDTFDINIDMGNYPDASSIRLVPIEEASIITDLEVFAFNEKGEKVELNMNWTTGIKVDDHTVILSKDGCEINYLLNEDTLRVQIKGNGFLVDEPIYQTYKKLDEIINLHVDELERIKNTLIYKCVNKIYLLKKRIFKGV